MACPACRRGPAPETSARCSERRRALPACPVRQARLQKASPLQGSTLHFFFTRDSLWQVPPWQARHHTGGSCSCQEVWPFCRPTLASTRGLPINYGEDGLKGLVRGWPDDAKEGRRRTATEGDILENFLGGSHRQPHCILHCSITAVVTGTGHSKYSPARCAYNIAGLLSRWCMHTLLGSTQWQWHLSQCKAAEHQASEPGPVDQATERIA